MLPVLIIYFLLAITFIIGKESLLYAQPIFIVGVRMILGGLLLLGYIYFFNHSQWRFNRKDWWLFAKIAFFHIFLSFVLEFWAYGYVANPAKVAFMYNLSPFITALFAYFMFSERMNSRKWLGLAIGFIGTIPVLIAETPAEELASGSFFWFSFAELGLLVSATSAVYGWMVMKTLVVKKHYSPILVNGTGMFIGGIGALITSFCFEATPLLKCPSLATNSSCVNGSLLGSLFCFSWQDFGMFMFYIAILILIANVIFYNFYSILLKKHTPTFMSLVGLLCPLFVAFQDWLLRYIGLLPPGPGVTWHFFVSLIIIMIGAYLYYQDELTIWPEKDVAMPEEFS